MIRILFICWGNICRSAMAQCVMQHLVNQAGLADAFVIDSAATTDEEIGNLIYPPARRKLESEGIPIVAHRARKIKRNEGPNWDYIICMDDTNVRQLKHILAQDDFSRVHKLLSFVGESDDVADPWYTRDFDATYRDVLRSCNALLEMHSTR